MRLFKNLFAFEESKKQMDEEILFHYTNEVGLQGILQNKCLWATDAFATNDSSEIELGNDLFVKNLQEWVKQNNRSEIFITLMKLKDGFKSLICGRKKRFEPL